MDFYENEVTGIFRSSDKFFELVAKYNWTMLLVDKNGGYPASDPQTPENLAATIYQSLGLPQTTAWFDVENRPHHIYHGEPIRGL